MLPEERVAVCLIFMVCFQAQAKGMVFIYSYPHHLTMQWYPGDSIAAGMNGGVFSFHSTIVPLGHTDNGLQRGLLPGSRVGQVSEAQMQLAVGFLNRDE